MNKKKNIYKFKIGLYKSKRGYFDKGTHEILLEIIREQQKKDLKKDKDKSIFSRIFNKKEEVRYPKHYCYDISELLMYLISDKLNEMNTEAEQKAKVVELLQEWNNYCVMPQGMRYINLSDLEHAIMTHKEYDLWDSPMETIEKILKYHKEVIVNKIKIESLK